MEEGFHLFEDPRKKDTCPVMIVRFPLTPTYITSILHCKWKREFKVHLSKEVNGQTLALLSIIARRSRNELASFLRIGVNMGRRETPMEDLLYEIAKKEEPWSQSSLAPLDFPRLTESSWARLCGGVEGAPWNVTTTGRE